MDCPFCGDGPYETFELKVHLLSNMCDEFDVADDMSIPRHFHQAHYQDNKLTDECHLCGRDLWDRLAHK